MPLFTDSQGNVWEATGPDDPNPVFVRGASQGRVIADPTIGPKVEGKGLDNQGKGLDNQGKTITNQVSAGTAPTTIATNQAPPGFIWNDPNDVGKGVRPIPGYSRQGISPEIRQGAIQAFSDADALERAADELDRLYKAGPGATKGVWGLQDYLPSTTNKVFDDAGQQARGYVKRALGFTGGEGNTAAESGALYNPYLPQAGDRDEQIVAKIAKLRGLAEDARKKSVTTLGGIPDANGNIAPVQQDERGSAWDQNRIVERGGPGLSAFGAEQQSIPVDPEYQREYGAFLQQWAANPDPKAYVQKRIELDQRFGYDSKPDDYAVWAETAAGAIRQGGADVPSKIPGMNAPLDSVGQIRNNLVNNPLGAAAAGAGDMAGFGAISALAPDQMQALGDANPVSMGLGQVAGAIAGTGALGGLASRTAGRLVPALLGGGGKGQFARNLATDVGYSGIYGGVSEGDVAGNAVVGGIGSVAGQGVGKIAGAALGGVKSSAAADYLRSRNIPMTVGQRAGGMVKGIEDRLAGMPVVGDMVNARRLEGLQGFNKAAFADAGQSIGYTPGNIGKEGVQELIGQQGTPNNGAVGNAYDQATQGVNVPLDSQFLTDLSAVAQKGQQLPDDLRNRFGLALQNRIQPIADAGGMTGDIYQQAVRGLKSYRAENVKPGFEQDYRDALGGSIDALTGNMQRGGGDSVVTGLRNADTAYRSTKTLQDAITRASGGSGSGENFVFTPSQLQRAGQASSRKYPGQQPFEELADYGQQVLPSQVPDSGTAGRLATIALGGGLTGAGAGLGAVTGGGEAAQTGGLSGLALAALLAAGGTRSGQKALGTVLFDRPDSIKRAAELGRRNLGLFGSAGVPLALTYGQ